MTDNFKSYYAKCAELELAYDEIDQLRARIAEMEEQLENKTTHITWNEEGVRLVNGVPDNLAPGAAPNNESDALLHCLKLAFPGKEISPAAMEMLYPSEAPKGAVND